MLRGRRRSVRSRRLVDKIFGQRRTAIGKDILILIVGALLFLALLRLLLSFYLLFLLVVIPVTGLFYGPGSYGWLVISWR